MNVHMIKGKTDNCYLVTDGKRRGVRSRKADAAVLI